MNLNINASYALLMTFGETKGQVNEVHVKILITHLDKTWYFMCFRKIKERNCTQPIVFHMRDDTYRLMFKYWNETPATYGKTLFSVWLLSRESKLCIFFPAINALLFIWK